MGRPAGNVVRRPLARVTGSQAMPRSSVVTRLALAVCLIITACGVAIAENYSYPPTGGLTTTLRAFAPAEIQRPLD